MSIAGSDEHPVVNDGQCTLTIQHIVTSFTACEMKLPAGIDILLGQDWQREHHATLLTWQGQVNFLDDNSLPACWRKRSKLASEPFNSSVNLSSASRINKGKQYYICFVRPVQSPVANATCATVQGTAQTAEPTADAHPEPADKFVKLFVEQDSARQEIKELVQQYAVVFPDDMPEHLPPERDVSHAIPLQPGASVPANKTYRLSKPQREEMERQIQNLLKKGWIRPSSSPYGSPILFVPKKDGGMRMCVDYRAVNKMTVRNNYPLPRIDDHLDRLSGAKMFSCLDLQQAYHQIRLSESDIPKTAFTTPHGLYEYLVLPFGLTNAPSTFQTLVNSVLGSELRHCCLVYLDDIIVFSANPEEHMEHLRLVLSKLQSHHLFAKLSKCRFALSSVKFLGHIVDQHGILPDPAKVATVLDWPAPTNVTEARSFVGLAQYFRKFIQGFSSLCAPLTALFKKGAEFAWTPACQSAFDEVTAALTTAPCLKLADNDVPVTVITDASGTGIGGILMQSGRPVAFDSRRLTPTEAKWSATEQETLGVVYHLEKWRCYLEGVPFTVVTDHQPNTWFASQRQLSPRQARWYERLRSFDFTWEYRPGRLNVADPLSRNPAFSLLIMASAQPTIHVGQALISLRSKGPPASLPPLPASQGKRSWDMRNMLNQAHSLRWGGGNKSSSPRSEHPDPVPAEAQPKIKRSKVAGKPGPPDGGQLRAAPINPDLQMPPVPVSQPLSLPEPDEHMQPDDQSGQVSAQPVEQHVDPAADTPDSWALSGSEHMLGGDAPMHVPLTDPVQVLDSIRKGYLTDPLYADQGAAKRQQLGIQPQGTLFRHGEALCVPDLPELRRGIISELHSSPYAGHVGVHRTHKFIARYFYWPNLQADILVYVRGCVMCQRNKPATGVPAGKLQPLPVPKHIWEDISMDFIGPLPKTSRGHDFILVVVDRLSKMAHFLPCKTNINGPALAQLFLDRIYSLHGLPKSVVTDRGTQFLNSFNTALCSLLGTRHAVSSAYHPETDGQTERINRVLGEMLRHYTNLQYDDWDLHLPLCEFAHNNSYSSAIGMTPFFACYGKHPRTPMNAIMEAAIAAWEAEPQDNSKFLSASEFLTNKRAIVRLAQVAMESARQRMQYQEEHKRKPVTFAEGDQVSLKSKHLGIHTLPSRKLFPLWLGPFTVSKVINPAAYQLELPHFWKAHNVFHVSLLKPYLDNGEPVDPLSFTLTGGKAEEFEVECINDYGPKTAHANGKPRKVSELFFKVKWRGCPEGLHARQPYANVKKNAPDALKDLAVRNHLAEDIFSKGSNRMPIPPVP